MKKQVYISGKLHFPLEEGKKAVIITYNNCIYTSPVVKIFETNEDIAYFETMNSIYRVSLLPTVIKAALLKNLVQCA